MKGTELPRNLKDSQNWRYGEIYINEDATESQSPTMKKMIICHEMGHVMGLKDIDVQYYSIMDSKWLHRVSTTTNDAVSAINSKYP